MRESCIETVSAVNESSFNEFHCCIASLNHGTENRASRVNTIPGGVMHHYGYGDLRIISRGEAHHPAVDGIVRNTDLRRTGFSRLR